MGKFFSGPKLIKPEKERTSALPLLEDKPKLQQKRGNPAGEIGILTPCFSPACCQPTFYLPASLHSACGAAFALMAALL